jgi:hypothetical protein
MKKARIMLVIIALLGLAGGILAFKASRPLLIAFYYYTTINGKGYCAKTTFIFYTTVVESGAPTTTVRVSTTYNAITSTSICPLYTLYIAD